MRNTVSALFNTPPPTVAYSKSVIFPSEQLVGVEVEVEGVYSASNLEFWSVTGDGSLRNNGVEYISPPMCGARIEESLMELGVELPRLNATAGSRCSVHCHLDFTKKPMTEVMAFLTGFALFECILFSASGKDRYWNMYTPGLSSCYAQVSLAREIQQAVSLKDYNRIRELVHRWNKYSCINLRSLMSLGTIEIRSLSGTTDMQEVKEWILMLMQLMEYTHGKTCAEIIEAAHEGQHLEVFKGTQYSYDFYTNNLCNAADIASAEEG